MTWWQDHSREGADDRCAEVDQLSPRAGVAMEL